MKQKLAPAIGRREEKKVSLRFVRGAVTLNRGAAVVASQLKQGVLKKVLSEKVVSYLIVPPSVSFSSLPPSLPLSPSLFLGKMLDLIALLSLTLPPLPTFKLYVWLWSPGKAVPSSKTVSERKKYLLGYFRFLVKYFDLQLFRV
jgi:hypothetical protein